MALVVQQGETVVIGADSYASLATADAYFADHGDPAAWSGAISAAKEAALRYGFQWLESNMAWIGRLSTLTDLDRASWPRVGARSSDGRIWTGTPHLLVPAQCELALVHLSDSLNKTSTSSAQIKAIETEDASVTYREGADLSPDYSYAISILSPIGWFIGSEVRVIA